jgi:hypothetical protein
MRPAILLTLLALAGCALAPRVLVFNQSGRDVIVKGEPPGFIYDIRIRDGRRRIVLQGDVQRGTALKVGRCLVRYQMPSAVLSDLFDHVSPGATFPQVALRIDPDLSVHLVRTPAWKAPLSPDAELDVQGFPVRPISNSCETIPRSTDAAPQPSAENTSAPWPAAASARL